MNKLEKTANLLYAILIAVVFFAIMIAMFVALVTFFPKEYNTTPQARKTLSGFQMKDQRSRLDVLEQEAKVKDYIGLFGWTPRYKAYLEAGKSALNECISMFEGW